MLPCGAASVYRAAWAQELGKVTVTSRPGDIAPKDAPFLKDLDDVWRYDPELVPELLSGANLEHGRLGDAVDAAILDAASRLGRDRAGAARARASPALLGIHRLGSALDDKLAADRSRTGREEREGEAEKVKTAHGLDAHGTRPGDFDIGGVLDDAARIMKKYVAAPDTHFDTVALWCLHTHLIHREELGVDVTSRLGFQSPEPDSGKSTFMKLVRELVPRPKGTGSISSSALFRAVDARKCTLLVDEADYAFRSDTNPDLLAIFNSGNERAFAIVTRSVPLGEGKFEDHDFNTFAAMAFTSIDKLSTKSMQSRCISLPMKPATKEEAKVFKRFQASKAKGLKDCHRKIARWAADLPALPEVEIPENFVNRVADNWRTLVQIAHLAGGDWPERALAAAAADQAGDGEEKQERGANGLLLAIWSVLAAETTDPRRMHTIDLVRKLKDLDDGRWYVANKGKPVDEYYLRSGLKAYVQPNAKDPDGKTRPRQWKAPGKAPVMRWGYHELHFRDAFLRYLGKGLPSAPTPEPADEEGEGGPAPSFSTVHPPASASSASYGVSQNISKTYLDADNDADADTWSASESSTSDDAHADADHASASRTSSSAHHSNP